MFWHRETIGVDGADLVIGGVKATELAREFGTPLYVMDEATLRGNCRAYRRGVEKSGLDIGLFYASKALCNKAVLKLVSQEGFGVDVVSFGEWTTARAVGIVPANIMMHGNSKSDDELAAGIGEGASIVVNDPSELERIIVMARQMGRRARVLFRLRPGIEAHTHYKIRTASLDCKFGFGVSDGAALAGAQRCAECFDAVELYGLHCHIGSQIFEVSCYRDALDILFELSATIRQTTGINIVMFNLGGGVGIAYVPTDDPYNREDFVTYVAEAARQSAAEHGEQVPRLVLEPGRSIVGDAGLTLYSVVGENIITGVRRYVLLDGGMGDNLRVGLYGAQYTALAANRMDAAPQTTVTLAGRCCESGDVLVRDCDLPNLQKGDLVATVSTGAYHASMANRYNRYPDPAMVLAGEGRARLIQRRPTWEQLMALDEELEG